MQLLKEYLGDENKAVQTDDLRASYEKNAKVWTMVPAQFFAKRKIGVKTRNDSKPPIKVVHKIGFGKQKLSVV